MLKFDQVGLNRSCCRGRTQGARVTGSLKPFFSFLLSSFFLLFFLFFLLFFYTSSSFPLSPPLLFRFGGARTKTKGSPQGRGLGRSPRSQTVHHGEEEKNVKHDSK